MYSGSSTLYINIVRRVNENADRTLAEGKQGYRLSQGWVSMLFVSNLICLYVTLATLEVTHVLPFLHKKVYEKAYASSWYCLFSNISVVVVPFESTIPFLFIRLK